MVSARETEVRLMSVLGAFVNGMPPATARTMFARDVVGACERMGDCVSLG
ncbi:MAG: hypothetical protein R6U98_12800 [Pirellulaceae bacterium]